MTTGTKTVPRYTLYSLIHDAFLLLAGTILMCTLLHDEKKPDFLAGMISSTHSVFLFFFWMFVLLGLGIVAGRIDFGRMDDMDKESFHVGYGLLPYLAVINGSLDFVLGGSIYGIAFYTDGWMN